MRSGERPDRLGPYRVEESLGAGATGEVFRAVGPDGEAVAIKVPRPPDGRSDGESRVWIDRYLESIGSAATVSHPQLVSVREIHRRDDPAFVVLELVDGESLEERLQRPENIAAADLLDWAEDLARALDAAHEKDRLHLAVHPSNVLLEPERGAVLAGLGEGALLEWNGEATDVPLVTLVYASPEVVAGRPATGASDQFSLAAIVYRVLAGRSPFPGDDPAEIRYRIVHHEPVPLATLQPDLPEAVDRVIRRGMHRDPLQRYPDCSTFAEALRGSLAELSAEAMLPLADPPVGKRGPEPTSGEVGGSEAPAPSVPTDGSKGDAGFRSLAAAAADARPRHWIAVAVALLAVGVVAWAAWSWSRSPSTPPDATVTAPEGTADDGFPGGSAAGDEPAMAAGGPEAVREDGSEGDEETGTAGGAGESGVEDPGAGEPEPGELEPEPLRSRLYRITSRPSNAHVMLDGVPTRMTTPVELAIRAGVDHRLSLSLEGYETLNWEFSVEGLSPEQRESRHLHFLLTPAGSDPSAASDDVPMLRAPADIEPPERVRHVDPVYPSRLRREGVEGYVILEVEIDAEGRVVEAEVLKELHPVLDQAAVDAVRDWRYRPPRRNGEPVRVRYAVTVFFPPS